MASISKSPVNIHIEILGPPAAQLKQYDLSISATKQPPSSGIPQTFIDAVSIREAIFVHEQGLVALEHHINAEDGRAFHFVAYVDDASSSSKSLPRRRIPIGNLRVLPSPHGPHPEAGSVIHTPKPGEVVAPKADHLFGEVMETEIRKGQQEMRKTSLHDGREGWLYLARMCVLKEWRGKGVADALVAQVVKWGEKEFVALERERARLGAEDEKNELGAWKGLLLCNARQEAKRMWERNGFVEDANMGRWTEVGVELFGMGRRVDLNSSSSIDGLSI